MARPRHLSAFPLSPSRKYGVLEQAGKNLDLYNDRGLGVWDLRTYDKIGLHLQPRQRSTRFEPRGRTRYKIGHGDASSCLTLYSNVYGASVEKSRENGSFCQRCACVRRGKLGTFQVRIGPL
jgi:hypothetical protein